MINAEPSQPALEARGIQKSFFGLKVLDSVSFAVQPGELLSIIGPNGSGKTTLFNIITGFLRADAGEVRYRGRDITRKPPHAISLLGVSRTFQDVRLFANLSVLDNLLIAIQQHQEESLVGRFFWTPHVRRCEQMAIERAHEMLELIGLMSFVDMLAGRLSYGQRKLLEFGIGIMARPALLLLDEPAAAVNPTMINVLKDHIVAYNREGHTVVLIEHNMEVVMDISHRVLVLDYGKLISEGTPSQVREDPLVLEAYFGR